MKLFFILAIIFVLILVALMMYMYKTALETNILEHTIRLKGRPEKRTFFFISDIHTRELSPKDFQHLHGELDFIVIGGDLADKRTPLSRLRKNIKMLSLLAPVYYVWGNNDREVGEGVMRGVMEEYGVRIVENNSYSLNTQYNNWRIVGIDDIVTGDADAKAAFRAVEEEDLVVFISHSPVVFPYIQSLYSPNILLGGHLHGGQIRFGPFGLHEQGSLEQYANHATLISNGFGTTLLPFRLGAKPECHVIHVVVGH